jgi:hypothetical protein
MLIAHLEENLRVTKRTTPAIAGNTACFDINNFGLFGHVAPDGFCRSLALVIGHGRQECQSTKHDYQRRIGNIHAPRDQY